MQKFKLTRNQECLLIATMNISLIIGIMIGLLTLLFNI